MHSCTHVCYASAHTHTHTGAYWPVHQDTHALMSVMRAHTHTRTQVMDLGHMGASGVQGAALQALTGGEARARAEGSPPHMGSAGRGGLTHAAAAVQHVVREQGPQVRLSCDTQSQVG